MISNQKSLRPLRWQSLRILKEDYVTVYRDIIDKCSVVLQLKCHQYWPIDEGHTVVYGAMRVHMRSLNHCQAWIERIMHVQHAEVKVNSQASYYCTTTIFSTCLFIVKFYFIVKFR